MLFTQVSFLKQLSANSTVHDDSNST